jgi:hypothetical protein
MRALKATSNRFTPTEHRPWVWVCQPALLFGAHDGNERQASIAAMSPDRTPGFPAQESSAATTRTSSTVTARLIDIAPGAAVSQAAAAPT